jgi:ATP-dependent exoDNAse (exonuclease V) beta subunit
MPLFSDRTVPLYDTLQKADTGRFKEAFGLLDAYRARISEHAISLVIEDILTETESWKLFHEPQRHANVKKFLRIIENLEAQGMSPLDIKETLIRSKKSSEAKATAGTEHLDAVRVMTIHGAKGRQFPVVFLPSLDESFTSKSGPVFLDETEGGVRFAYEDDASRRRKNDLFRKRREKELEEEKRLFYVAVTRAMDHLVLSGALKRSDAGNVKIQNCRLAFLENAFPSSVSGEQFTSTLFRVSREKEIPSTVESVRRQETRRTKKPSGPVYTEAVDFFTESLQWVDVTEDIKIKAAHGEDWVILGRIFHRLFEELSKNILSFNDLGHRIGILLDQELNLKHPGSSYKALMTDTFHKLEKSGHLHTVIMPSEHSYAELPFILQKGNIVYKGRIDRVLIRDDTVIIYDYKTFPFSEKEIPGLIDTYRFQMDMYREACSTLFSLKTRAFILFTHAPVEIEV